MSFIKKIRIQNFKSLEDVTLDIKPLNFLFGPNSSGKSSVLKAIMFLKKNLFTNNYHKSIYKLSDYIDLVSYIDIVSSNDIGKNIIFELNVSGNFLFYKKPFDDNEPLYHYEIIGDGAYKKGRDLHNEHLFNITVKIEFSESGINGKLEQIKIEDHLENTHLIITNNSDQTWLSWDISIEDNGNPELLLLKKKLVNRNENPFQLYKEYSHQDIMAFENMELNESNIIDDNILLNAKEKASRLYYLYYYVLPNILNYSLSSAHMSTVRKLPVKTFILNDEGDFDRKDYYQIINNVCTYQNKLLDAFFAEDHSKLSAKTLTNNYKILVDQIISFLNILEVTIKEKNIKVSFVEYMQDLFELFDSLKYGKEKIDTFDKILERCMEEIKGDRQNYSYFYIFKFIDIKYLSLLYKLYEINEKMETDYLNVDIENIPRFYYNLSIQINLTLLKLGFNTSIVIFKDENIGKILSLKKNATEFNIINESSGLLQIMPILLALVYLKRDILTSSIKTKYFTLNLNTLDFLFTKHDRPGFQEMSFVNDKENLISVIPDQPLYSLLIEQPELHLHPKLQCGLAEYIGGVANYFTHFNNMFVETHSEHIIRKIQVLVAKGTVNNTNLAVNYLYMVGGKTYCKKMYLNDDGFFKEPWPDGFFDDSYNLTKELLYANKN